MIALVGSVLGASLLGSPHCAAMCGGFVCFYAGQEGGRRRWLAHLAYNGGRLLSYTTLGALAGGLGAGIERAGAGFGLSRAAAVAAGLLMVAWGLAAIQRARRTGRGAAPALGSGIAGSAGAPRRSLPARAVSRVLRAVHARPPAQRALAVGLLSTLLPCGWLYAFVATAAGSGDPGGGALIMAVFWTGTLPVMAGLGVTAQRALGPLRARLPIATAALLVVLGLLTVAGKFSAPAAAHHHHHPPVEHVGD